MTDASSSPLVRRLGAYRKIDDADLQALAGADGEVEAFDAGALIWATGEQPAQVSVVESGWAIHARELATGDRQICQILLPGDLLDGVALLPGGCTTTLVQAVTPLEVRHYEPGSLVTILKERERLGEAFWWSSLQTTNILREHIVRTSGLTAAEALSHLFLELLMRCEMAGVSDGKEAPMPLTQVHVGEHLGLTPVHVSRTASLLRRLKLADWSGRTLTVHNRPDLIDFCGFDAEYLYCGCVAQPGVAAA